MSVDWDEPSDPSDAECSQGRSKDGRELVADDGFQGGAAIRSARKEFRHPEEESDRRQDDQ
jgi:hypothetical protein